MTLEGACYCGALRYQAEGEPKLKGQCHCRECQYISGGGPKLFMLMPQDGFGYTTGAPKSFTPTDLDSPVTREFCEACGTHIASRRSAMPAVILKIGTLDDPEEFGLPQMAVYTVDKEPYHVVPEGMPSFERLPGD